MLKKKKYSDTTTSYEENQSFDAPQKKTKYVKLFMLKNTDSCQNMCWCWFLLTTTQV